MDDMKVKDLDITIKNYSLHLTNKDGILIF